MLLAGGHKMKLVLQAVSRLLVRLVWVAAVQLRMTATSTSRR